jgi:light-regulated signal transduction histidine kinase (bacteriophytochrome)
MTALINDLLSYTRAAQYEQEPPAHIDAGQVLAEVFDRLRGPIEVAGARVVAEHLPTVVMHKSRLAQQFQNLSSNALKYRGSEPPQIAITAEVRDGWYVFSVSDNGIGIASQFAHQIFGLFKRLHRPDQYSGSGMGLAICQRIVGQYGGRIWLQASDLDKGSTSCFSVPCRNQ